MPKNMGTADRIIRSLLGVAIVVLYFTHAITGTVAIVLGLIAAAFLISSALSTCPIYLPFGWSTRSKPGSGSEG